MFLSFFFFCLQYISCIVQSKLAGRGQRSAQQGYLMNEKGGIKY